MSMDELDLIFRQLGMVEPEVQKRTLGATSLSRRRSEERSPFSSITQSSLGKMSLSSSPVGFPDYSTAQQEQYKATQTIGIAKQFIHGGFAPIGKTLSALDFISKETMEKIPEPQTLMESLAYGAGSILTYATLLTPIFGKIAAAGLGVAAPGVAATLATAGKAAPLSAKIAQGLAMGAVSGAHSAWVEEDKKLLPSMASSMAWFTGATLVGAGVGEVIKRTGLLQKVPQDLMSIGYKTPRRPSDIKSLLKALPEDKAVTIHQQILDNINARADDFPSSIDMTEIGEKIGAEFNSWSQAKREMATWLYNFGGIAEIDTIFKPLMESPVGQLHHAGKILAKIQGKDQDLMEQVMRKSKAVPVDQSLTTDKMLSKIVEATNLSDQYAEIRGAEGRALGSFKRTLRRYGLDYGDWFSNVGKLDDRKQGVVFKALDRLTNRQTALQDLMWQIQGEAASKIGSIDPRKIQSTLLVKAITEAPGAKQAKAVWNKDIHNVLHQVNEKFGLSLDSPDTLYTEAQKNLKLKPFADQMKQVIQQMKADGQPMKLGVIGMNLFEVDTMEDLSVEELHEMFRNALETGSVIGGSYHEEMMLRYTKPIPIIDKLLPIRKIFGDSFTNAARSATQEYHMTLNEFLGDEGLSAWIRSLGLTDDRAITEAGQRIQQFLENPEISKDVMKNIKGAALTSDIVKRYAKQYGLSGRELKVAVEMREAWDKLFNLAKLDPKRYREAYFPHLKRMTGFTWDRVSVELRQLGFDEKEIKGVRWVNEMIREDVKFDYETDAFKVFLKYTSGAAKKIHFDELFEKWTEIFNKMKVHPDRLERFEDLKRIMLGRPGDVEKYLDKGIRFMAEKLKADGLLDKAFGNRPSAAISAMLAELQISSGLGYNPFVAVKNLTQKLLILPEAGDGNWIEGLNHWAKWRSIKNTPTGKWIQQLNPIVENRQYHDALSYSHSALTGFAELMGITPSTTKALRDNALHWYKMSDMSNVTDAFGTRFLSVFEKGASVQEATEMALATTMATQYMYGFDSPLLYKTPLGKQMGLFMSWPLNFATLLWEQATTEGDVRKAISTIGLMAIGAETLSLTGLNFGSIHPIETARGLLPVALASGEENWPSPLRSAAAVMGYLRALSKNDPVAIDYAFDNLKRRATTLLPAGAEAQRILSTITVAKNEWKVYDNKGRLQRELNKDNIAGRILGIPGEAIRGAVGPTVEARHRWEDWEQVQKMDSSYRRLRRIAIMSFLDGNYQKFLDTQERLLLNFGRQITPQDIRQEVSLREKTALERQMTGLPLELRESFLESRVNLH